MNEEIERKQKEASDKFDELTKQKTQKEQEIKDIDSELLRLQGEYRALETFKTKDEAVTIKAEEKTNGRKPKG